MAVVSLGTVTIDASTSEENVDAYEVDNSIISLDESHLIRMSADAYVLQPISEHISIIALQNFSMQIEPSSIIKLHNLRLQEQSVLHVTARENHVAPSSLSHISLVDIPAMSLFVNPSITIHRQFNIEFNSDDMNVSSTIVEKREPIKIFRYNLLRPTIKINVSRMTHED